MEAFALLTNETNTQPALEKHEVRNSKHGLVQARSLITSVDPACVGTMFKRLCFGLERFQ